MRRLLLRISLSSVFLVFAGTSTAFGSVALGVGTTGSTDGRPVPSLYGQADFSDLRASLFSSGVKTSVYYQSAWQVHLMKKWSVGELWGGPIEGGFGAGIHYVKRGYKDAPTASTASTSEDVAFGPAFRAEWNFGGPVFLAVEGLFGLQPTIAHVLLSFQEIGAMAIGVKF